MSCRGRACPHLKDSAVTRVRHPQDAPPADGGRSQLDAVRGLMAGQIQPERVRVDTERFGGFERDPLDGDGQREDRQQLTQTVMGDAGHRTPASPAA